MFQRGPLSEDGRQERDKGPAPSIQLVPPVSIAPEGPVTLESLTFLRTQLSVPPHRAVPSL